MQWNNLITEIRSFFSKEYAYVQAEKKRIRHDIRLQKKIIPDEQKNRDEVAVFDRIEQMPEFRQAKTILMYWAIRDELPTQATIAKWSKTKSILLPSIVGNKLVLKTYFPEGKMVQQTLGIWEPDLTETYKGAVDLVIVPGIAFDRRKNRLGRGKGFYDRFFKKFKPFKIGVGFNFQLQDSIPAAKHDVKMDRIVTPSEVVS